MAENEPPRSKLRGISRLVAALKTKQASGNITRRDLKSNVSMVLTTGNAASLILLSEDRFSRSKSSLSIRRNRYVGKSERSSRQTTVREAYALSIVCNLNFLR